MKKILFVRANYPGIRNPALGIAAVTFLPAKKFERKARPALPGTPM